MQVSGADKNILKHVRLQVAPEDQLQGQAAAPLHHSCHVLHSILTLMTQSLFGFHNDINSPVSVISGVVEVKSGKW